LLITCEYTDRLVETVFMLKSRLKVKPMSELLVWNGGIVAQLGTGA